MNSISTLKVHNAETRSLIEKIKAEIKKRAEAKARRMLLKAPKKANATLIDHLARSLSCLKTVRLRRSRRQNSRLQSGCFVALMQC